MKYYAPENAAFLLPFQFDPEKMRSDLERCQGYDFLKNYVPENYDGKDYILPLRSIEGRMDFPVASPNNADKYQDTEALDHCSYFQEVINTFQCDKETVRLMNLPSGRVVNTHTDLNCGYEDSLFRVHIPIVTNDEVRFTLNNKDLIMRPGEAWYTNVNLPHSVKNLGKTSRVHLVLDCIRNDWSDQVFAAVGFDFTQEREVEENLSKDRIIRIIEELQYQNTPQSLQVIQNLRNRIQKK